MRAATACFVGTALTFHLTHSCQNCIARLVRIPRLRGEDIKRGFCATFRHEGLCDLY